MASKGGKEGLCCGGGQSVCLRGGVMGVGVRLELELGKEDVLGWVAMASNSRVGRIRRSRSEPLKNDEEDAGMGGEIGAV